jgi:AraC-like DNA-binding protein
MKLGKCGTDIVRERCYVSGKRAVGRTMSVTTGEGGSFGLSTFSTEDLRLVDRIPIYRDAIGRAVASYDVKPVSERFSCKARFCWFPGLGISDVAGSAVRASWTHMMAETETAPGLVLVINLAGAVSLSHLGRHASVPAGNSILFSAADASRMERTTSHFVLIAVPHSVLAPMLSNLDAMLMSVTPNTIEPLRLLPGYIDLLIKDPVLMRTAELRRLAVQHVHDLVAMALGATCDAAEIAAGRGLRAARMRAIKADIAQNLEGNVTAAALSLRHRVSPRYIRKLFESENTSLSQFVLAQRLTRVHRLLTEPRYDDRNISHLAFAAGFGDLSTFNREFRRRFGVTPSDVRYGTR